MGALAKAGQLALAILLAIATVREASAGSCPTTPRTGCRQSSQVTFTPTSWTWTADGVDYMANRPTRVPPTSPGSSNNHVLCVYDGSAALATDFTTPVETGPGQLLFDSSDSGGIVLTSSQADSITASFTWGAASTLIASKKAATISQLISGNGKSCWAKAVSIKLPPSGAPAMPPIPNLTQASGLQLLNLLAARYNANAEGEPLNLVTWLAAIAPTQIISSLVGETTPATAAHLLPGLSALHLAGIWGGAWFQRDGFSGQLPFFAAPDTALAPAYGTALFVPFPPNTLVQLQQYANFILAINSSDPNAFAGAAGSFGYNVGYTQVILTAGEAKGPAYVPEDDVGLSCDLGKLFQCAITPKTIKLLDQLKSEVNQWSAALPGGSTAVQDAVAIQERQSARGAAFWGTAPPAGPPLVAFVKPEPPILWQSLYRVNNLFLEALQLAGRLLVRGLTLALKEDTTAAAALKEAALVQSAASAWLASYGVGLGTPAPQVLPQFDLGTTALP